MNSYLTGAGAAVLALALAAPAKADCAWSIGLLRHKIALTQEIAPIAASAGKESQTKFDAALGAAQSALVRAESLLANGQTGACDYAVEAAQQHLGEARQALPRAKNG